mmetsp:Transcript_44967/g.109217  ORF Transcript_44967/g.109217 Transcript_44967/m.109217 type:complete len:673 (-) Transcript_44967:2423-4441(-)
MTTTNTTTVTNDDPAVTEEVATAAGTGTSTLTSTALAVVEDQDHADETEPVETGTTTTTTCCRDCCSYDGIPEAQGYSMLAMVRGSVIMSNIFLASSLIYLACEEADGLRPDLESDDPENNLTCTNPDENKVYGMTPSSLITNIAVVSPVLSALFMPVVGAIVDFTPHRRLVGKLSALLLVAIQTVQIGTTSQTWFPMAILQGIAGFVYQIQVVTVYAYLPEMYKHLRRLAASSSSAAGGGSAGGGDTLSDTAQAQADAKMNSFTSKFTMFQFASQATFNILILVVIIGFGLSTTVTAQVSQALSVFPWCIIGFTIGWHYKMPSRPAKHMTVVKDIDDDDEEEATTSKLQGDDDGDQPPTQQRPKKNYSIWTVGFVQNWNTTKIIHKHYSKGLKWYLYALIFAEASAAAITSVSVVYLNDTVGLSVSQIAIFFLIALIFTIPGSWLGRVVTSYTKNPNTSWKLSQLCLMIILFIGALTLNSEMKIKELSYIWGAAVGCMLGWFYPTENCKFINRFLCISVVASVSFAWYRFHPFSSIHLFVSSDTDGHQLAIRTVHTVFFSMCLPKGQEAELSGFFVYCTQILGWLPPLLFSIMNENGIDQKYGVIITTFGFVVSIALLSCTASWDEIVEEANRNAHEEDHFAEATPSTAGNDDDGEDAAVKDTGKTEEVDV